MTQSWFEAMGARVSALETQSASHGERLTELETRATALELSDPAVQAAIRLLEAIRDSDGWPWFRRGAGGGGQGGGSSGQGDHDD